uniref:Polyprotein n=1 Tax=Cajanus cajan TaxID=3821 RepID=A0A151SZX6_CAJCA|nr:polyprotein [Cajanus cajan]
MCLRDTRHNDFHDSLIGTVETSLGHGPVYFNCFPNKTVSLLDRNVLDSLFLNIRLHGLNMKEGSIPAALLYRIQYKVMNTCNSRVLLKTNDRETTLFVTDMTKANVAVPKLIKWDEVELPTAWKLERATPTLPRKAPEFQEIRQSEAGKVEIIFDRRNSFSSRTEATRSEYKTLNVFRSQIFIHILGFEWCSKYRVIFVIPNLRELILGFGRKFRLDLLSVFEMPNNICGILSYKVISKRIIYIFLNDISMKPIKKWYIKFDMVQEIIINLLNLYSFWTLVIFYIYIY